MKIFTQTYDLAKASPHRFWVAPFSEFKIGIKILEKGEISDKDFTVKAGSTEFTPDADKIDNFTLFTIKSNDTGFVEYTIEVEGVAEKLKLMQIVTDSTVFEIDAGGGGDVPADVATQTWVNSQISDFITEEALDGYATESYVDSATSSFVEEGELTAYATKAELTAYAETTDLTAYAEKTELTAYATKDELTGYVENGDLTAFYTKSETSSATELADAFANVGGGISIREALDNGICLPQTIFENADGTFGSLDLTGEVDFTEGRIGTGASMLSNAVRVNIGTNISAFGGRTFGWTGNLTSLVIPESVKRFNTYEMFSGSKLDNISATVRIPDSVTVFGTGSILWNSRSLTIDFGDTRKTIPSTSNLGSLAPGDTVYVPDSLYSAWIATANWTNPSNTKILPRSVMTAAQKVGKAKTGQAPIVNTIHSVYETDWATLSATADANTFYAVLPDPE